MSLTNLCRTHCPERSTRPAIRPDIRIGISTFIEKPHEVCNTISSRSAYHFSLALWPWSRCPEFIRADRRLSIRITMEDIPKSRHFNSEYDIKVSDQLSN